MAERSMHLVVVGGNGFVGSHFVASAVDAGHRVTVVGRRQRPIFEHGRPFEFLAGGIAALTASPDFLQSADCICHFATTTTPASSTADPVADIESNLVPVVQLLEAMRRHGNRRIMFLSSGGAVYGRPQTLPITENHSLAPVSSYGVVKAAIEQYLRMYEDNDDFRSTVIRLANPYGPGQASVGRVGAVNTFIDLALRRQPVMIWGDGRTVRDFVYISDVVDLLLSAVCSNSTGTFNCGAGVGTSLLDLIGCVEHEVGHQLERRFSAARSFDPPRIVLDIRHAERTFGWKPRLTLEAGVKATTAFLKTS